METELRTRLQVISLVLVIGLGGALLYRVLAQGGEPPSPSPAEQAAADRVSLLVASAVSAHVSTTADLSDGRTVDVTPELPGALADPAAASLTALRAQAALLVDPATLGARVSTRDTEVEGADGRTVIEATTAIVMKRERAAEATHLVSSTVTFDDATGEVLTFEASGLG